MGIGPIALLLGVATVVGTAPAPAVASVEPGRTITVELVVAPEIEAPLGVSLVLDGTDVTAEYCEPDPTTGPYGGPSTTCRALPDGTFSILLAPGAPDGLALAADCADAVGDTTDTPSIPWRGPLDGWQCQLWVAPSPTVVFRESGSVLPDGSRADVDLELTGPDGVIPLECSTGDVAGEPAQWCADVPLASYTARAVAPPHYRTLLTCESSNGSGPTSVTDDRSEVVLTVDDPIWICGLSGLFPPIGIELRIYDPLASSWVAGVAPVVTDASGVDVSELCDVRGDAAIPAPAPGDPPIWNHGLGIACATVPIGTYTVTLLGIPDDVSWSVLPGGQVCEGEVTETREMRCIFEARAERESPATTAPASTAPAPTPDVAATLPGTGGISGGWPVVAAAVLVLAGAVALVSSRRPIRS